MLLEGMYSETLVYNILHPEMKRMLWCANLDPRDVNLVISKPVNRFWRDVLSAWCKYHYTPKREESAQMIWCNSNIRVQDRPLFWKKEFNAGLMYVHDLIKNEGFISEAEALENFGLETLQYNMLKSAIPRNTSNMPLKSIKRDVSSQMPSSVIIWQAKAM